MEKKELSLNEYQRLAMATCMETSRNPLYMLFMLGEEMGELQGKYSKAIRKGNIQFDNNKLEYLNRKVEFIDEFEDLVKKELGDILWGCAGLCEVMGWKLNDIGNINIEKLTARKAAGTIDGNGDGIMRAK